MAAFNIKCCLQLASFVGWLQFVKVLKCSRRALILRRYGVPNKSGAF
jgi:hypothetical protein